MRFTLSPGPIVHKKIDFFGQYFQLKLENFSKTLLFEFLRFSKTLLFCSFIIFKRTHGTSIPSNYINFMKITNEWIVCDIIRLFWRLENAYFEN